MLNEEYIEYGEPDETGGEQAMVNLLANHQAPKHPEHKLFMPILVRRSSVGSITA
ncbi:MULTISPECIES: hypothetical protein [Vibrio]|uniref:hypothetical protein n=1 Tax=Vibrio TaxID=662 RepID=UPI001602A376|nr:hypothetical protein [Vibrio sp. PID23_8]